jgi:hypothetical protein
MHIIYKCMFRVVALPDSGVDGRGHYSRAIPAPRQVAHLRPNSVEISSPNGGTQCNGDHYFLRGENRSRWILLATHLFLLTHLENF